jgi:hypothetical protein
MHAFKNSGSRLHPRTIVATSNMFGAIKANADRGAIQTDVELVKIEGPAPLQGEGTGFSLMDNL